MASKQKQRVGEVQRAKGILYDINNGKYVLLKTHYTREESLLLLRTLGKRAQTRITTLGTRRATKDGCCNAKTKRR